MLRELVFTEFIAALRPGIKVGLIGGLGAGKTTFTGQVLKHLGVVEPVTSPSFGLCHEYEVRFPIADASDVGGEKYRFEHWDLYRLSSLPDELLFSNEASEGPVMRFIEWSDKFSELDSELDLKLFFEVEEDKEGRVHRSISW